MNKSNTTSKRLLDQVEAVLFDLDGTLLDTAPDLVNALFVLCDQEAQRPPDYRFAAQHVSTGALGLVRVAFPDHDDESRESLRDRLVNIYAANVCEHTRLYPGMPALLEELETTGIAWGVVTNKPKALTEPLLEQIGLRQRMGAVISGDSVAQRKPHPDPVLLALDEMGVQPAAAIYVGDASQDIYAGQAAGAITVAVTWGYIIPGHNPHDWKADYTIDHPDEFVGLPAPK